MQSIKGLNKKKGKEKISRLIEWTCKNSLNFNYSMLLPNAKLAFTHYKTLKRNQPDIIRTSTVLKDMYKNKITTESIS